jgi:hypothetical protein
MIWEDLTMAETLGQFLNERRWEKSYKFGGNDLITWSAICEEINRAWEEKHGKSEARITPQSLGRWEKDQTRPSLFVHYQMLALWFGPGVYNYMFRDAGIDPKLLYLVANQKEPSVQVIIERAHEDALDVLERGRGRGTTQQRAVMAT